MEPILLSPNKVLKANRAAISKHRLLLQHPNRNLLNKSAQIQYIHIGDNVVWGCAIGCTLPRTNNFLRNFLTKTIESADGDLIANQVHIADLITLNIIKIKGPEVLHALEEIQELHDDYFYEREIDLSEYMIDLQKIVKRVPSKLRS